LETLSGTKVLKLHIDNGIVKSVTVDMHEPKLAVKEQLATADGRLTEGNITINGITFCGTFVSMGNPHFVIFVDDIRKMDVARDGALLEHHPLFPQRCNIEFAQVLADGIRTRVWERGSGITMACGTGACATAVAAAVTKRTGRKSRIIMDGGVLEIDWEEADDHVYMTGPAEFSFEGSITIDE
jgi:diaminopimelate epimerase